MVAVCVVVNTLFPVVSAIEVMAAESYRVTVRHEDGSTEQLSPAPDVAARLHAVHGSNLHDLVGKPWQAILAGLQR